MGKDSQRGQRWGCQESGEGRRRRPGWGPHRNDPGGAGGAAHGLRLHDPQARRSRGGDALPRAASSERPPSSSSGSGTRRDGEARSMGLAGTKARAAPGSAGAAGSALHARPQDPRPSPGPGAPFNYPARRRARRRRGRRDPPSPAPGLAGGGEWGPGLPWRGRDGGRGGALGPDPPASTPICPSPSARETRSP